MSVADKRWAQRAQDLQFHQLEALRKQAESWRAGLAGLAALLGAVLVIKGPEDIRQLRPPFRYGAVALLALGLALLGWALLLALRAAAGAPGDEIYLTGEQLRSWTVDEGQRVSRALGVAARLLVGGLLAVAAAIGLVWLAPVQDKVHPLVSVQTGGGNVCGELIGSDSGQLVIGTEEQHRRVHLVSVAQVVTLKVVTAC